MPQPEYLFLYRNIISLLLSLLIKLNVLARDFQLIAIEVQKPLQTFRKMISFVVR